jgi:hypothetical protein
MPRDPFAALVQLLLGALLGAAGFLMIGWAVLTHFRIDMGFDALLWALEHSPTPLAVAPQELANSAIQRGSLIAIGIAGIVASIIGSALRRAGAKNMRPASASTEDPLIPHAPPAPPATTKHAGSTVFAHKMLSDLPSHAPSQAPFHASSHAPSHVPHTARPSLVVPATHTESPLSRREADLAGLARLIGTDGKFTPQQREALAKLTLEQHAALAKFSKWAPTRKNAIIALVAIFFAFQLLPAIFSFLLHR